MAVFDYKKYKVGLNADTHKTQGLRTGDIVRRQYFDGQNLVYSLMCVLENGVDREPDSSAIGFLERPYFIGALLEGNAPKHNELLDFARVTSLFDENRSGALYLTASDSESPYMDVIDGVGSNGSLCYPDGLNSIGENEDSQRQYILRGNNGLAEEYLDWDGQVGRVCRLVKTGELEDGELIGLYQEFYTYIKNPERVLISYKLKGATNGSVNVSMGYADGTRIDGEVNVKVSNDWQYHLHAITVEWSGRHLRAVRFDISDLADGDEVSIAELNIIPLSSISNFANSSQIRIGKLDGVHDSVFGKLSGYGSYLQKLYSSGSAHISGTLTAGDENGFASTFYAGRIHRNAFVNSLSPNFLSGASLVSDILPPTGIGNVYRLDESALIVAQSQKWVSSQLYEWHTFSFWAKSTRPFNCAIWSGRKELGVVSIDQEQTDTWGRHQITFRLWEGNTSDLMLILSISYTNSDNIDSDFLFTSPQLERGKEATQYQPTDDQLTYTDSYGAWFNSGGIGGTMQNPLLRLNFDGNGAIGTRTNSFVLRPDGSGHFADGNIQWDSNGNVRFGERVTLGWNNFSDDLQTQMEGKYVKILGEDTFTVVVGGDDIPIEFAPNQINLFVEEHGIPSIAVRQWYFKNGDSYEPIIGAVGKDLLLHPTATYWGGSDILFLKYVASFNQKDFTDTITIKKRVIAGYTLEVKSSQGETFRNGECETVLSANVKLKGVPVDLEVVKKDFSFVWRKYRLPDLDTEIDGWWSERYSDSGDVIHPAIDRTSPVITLNYNIDNQDVYVCEMQTNKENNNGFPITFQS